MADRGGDDDAEEEAEEAEPADPPQDAVPAEEVREGWDLNPLRISPSLHLEECQQNRTLLWYMMHTKH